MKLIEVAFNPKQTRMCVYQYMPKLNLLCAVLSNVFGCKIDKNILMQCTYVFTQKVSSSIRLRP